MILPLIHKKKNMFLFFFVLFFLNYYFLMTSQGADVWHLVGRYFSVVDLCRCMQVSPAWFHLWVSDRAWNHQRKRMCAMFPELTPIFDKWCDQAASGEHTSKRSQKSNSNKKRKTAWITPRRGIWYVFKKWLMMGTSVDGLKQLCKRDEVRGVVISVFKTHVPKRDEISTAKFKICKQRTTKGSRMYRVKLKWSPRVYIYFWILRGLDNINMQLEYLLPEKVQGYPSLGIEDDEDELYFAGFDPHEIWESIIFQDKIMNDWKFFRPWSDEFEEIVETRL